MSKLGLSGMGPQFEAPSADDNHRRVHNVLRGTIREQGQVTSLALANNAQLWEERKKLKYDLECAQGEARSLRISLDKAREELAKLSTPEHRSLHALRLENEELKRINEGLKKALQLHLAEAIDPSELKERFLKLEAQRKELESAGAERSDLTRLQDARAAAAREGREISAEQTFREAGVLLNGEEEPPTLPG